MRVNVKHSAIGIATHEGGPAKRISSEQQLRRTVLSCLLWEDNFYEDGVSVAERIKKLSVQVPPVTLAALAVEARTQHHLRHVPLLLLKCLAAHARGRLVEDTVFETIQRADELAEFVAIYWKDGRRPLSNPVKRGLARAFQKFSAYQLSKYNRDGDVRLRDVLFLVHPKPRDAAQAEAWKQLASGTLPPADTWEVALSSGQDKRATFERLIDEGKLGYLALLRNLRNMVEAGCDLGKVTLAILARAGAERVLPFRYVAAARACPSMEPAIDAALLDAINGTSPLPGKTLVLVDVSGSMDSLISSKSDMTRMDAAAALASIIRGDLRVFSFTQDTIEVPARRGMAGVDAIINSQPHGSTFLGSAVARMNQIPHDRLIVISDEQTADRVPPPVAKHAYMINVATSRHGVGYRDGWTHLDGFSEGILRFIAETERSIATS
jgi:hypothetical protein